MNVTKVRAAIENAQKECSTLYRETVAAGEKDDRQLDGIRPLAKANKKLTEALAKIDEAVERTQPREEKKKKGKGDK